MELTMNRLALGAFLAVLIGSVWAANPAAFSAEDSLEVDLARDLNWRDHHFAMTNWFYKYKWSDPAAQIDILAECGYGGAMLSLKDDPKRWKMLPAYLAALKKHKMRLTAIHARFYIEDGTYPQVIKDNLPLLKDTKVVLIPSVGSRTKLDRKDPKAVAMAVKVLREMSDDATKYGLGGIAPYMHIGNWIETIDDNVRIAKAVDRRNVGVMFHLHHWQVVGNRDLGKLRADLKKAKPYLMVVVIQGTDKDKATHRILGEGSFDMVPLVRMLREIDYRGPLGTMGYTQSGDVPGKLGRAYQAWKRIKKQALR
jgi:sugar phosphate isomerase/epimerase